MATFKINGKNFATQDGTGAATIHSDVVFPTGHIIQIVHDESSALDSSTADYASTFDDTNLSASITPNSATNYLLIHGVVNGGNSNSTQAIAFRFHILQQSCPVLKTQKFTFRTFLLDFPNLLCFFRGAYYFGQ